MGEAQRTMIVVELERGHAGGVSLKAQHQDVAHEAHVLRDILRDAVGGPLDVRAVERRTPALQLATLTGRLDTLLDVAHGVEVLIKLLTVGLADVTAKVSRLTQHRVEHAAVAGRGGILEESIKGEGRVDLQRGRGRRRAPRDVRAVQHRVILMHPGERAFAAEHETRHLGRATVGLRDHLVETGPGADLPPRGDGRTGEQVAGLRAVDVPLAGLLMVETLDEEQLGPEVLQRGQHLAEFHTLALPFRPPFLRVETVTGKERGDAHRRLAGGPVLLRLVAPDIGGLEPRQRHGHAHPSQESPPAELVLIHKISDSF